MKSLPVSVLVPKTKSREEFFHRFCLPSIFANNPLQLYDVYESDMSAPDKRNLLLGRASQPYVFFCDDDVVLAADALQVLLSAIEEDPGAAFAYSNMTILFHPGTTHKASYTHVAGRWEPERLKKANFVPNMALWKKDLHPGYDRMLRRFMDWDVALTAASRGLRGIWVNQTLMHAHQLDAGITLGVPPQPSLGHLAAKHGLGPEVETSALEFWKDA